MDQQKHTVPTPTGIVMAQFLPSLACIIVHYGSLEVTRGCLDSLLRSSARPWVVVVCNTPDNESVALLACVQNAHCTLRIVCENEVNMPQTDVCFVFLSNNKGFAAACNVGLRIAKNKVGVRFAWLLNNDTTVAHNATKALLTCLEVHPKALFGTSVFRADTPDRLELALGCRFSPLTTIIRPCCASTRPEEVQAQPTVDYIYGASLAFPLTVLDDIGFLDERFFLYYEEHDLCLRAKQYGYDFVWCRKSCVWHGQKITFDTMQQKLTAYKHDQETRSTVLFLRKHYPYYFLYAIFFRTVCKSIRAVQKHDFSFFCIYIKSLLNSFRCTK